MKEMLDKLTGQFRRLGFGFALGWGLGGITFIVLHAIFPALTIIPSLFLYSGGAIGFAFNQVFDRLYKAIISPVTKTLKFYTNLLQLLVLKKAKVIEEPKAKYLTGVMVDDYFLKGISNLKQIDRPKRVKLLENKAKTNDAQS